MNEKMATARWRSVKQLCDTARQYFAEGVQISESQPDSSYNLPFVLAYAVLDEVLSELKDQGAFPCPPKDWQLARKMLASKNNLPWRDYALVDEGREARNRLAHQAQLQTKADCLKWIKAIEVELQTWGVL